MIHQIRALDDRINEQFPFLGYPWISTGLSALTYLGSGFFCWTVYAILAFLTYRFDILYKFLRTAIVAELVMLFWVIIFRRITKRERPVPVVKESLFMNWNRYSFPSLHSARVFMLTYIASVFYHNVVFAMLPIAFAICFSRIYLKRHFFSDVMVGAIVGVFSGAMACPCPAGVFY